MALGDEPNDYDKHFVLVADIDLDPYLPGRKVFDKAVIAPDTNSWTYGLQGTPFTGEFNGNGHTISHLTIQGRAYVGLFGCLESDAKVRDLGVVDVKVSGDYPVGGLAGHNRFGSVVTQCHSTGTVSGEAFVGGLVVYNEEGTVTQCYSTSEVSGTGRGVGGLVGRNGWYDRNNGWYWGGEICECYSTGATTGASQVGGLVGMTLGGRVVNCFSTGAVSGSAYAGGLVGSGDPNDMNASFWDTQTSGQAGKDGGIGKTTGEMQTATTFLDAGWDFVGETANGSEDIWWINEGLSALVVGSPQLMIDDFRLMIETEHGPRGTSHVPLIRDRNHGLGTADER